jgi:AraC-like DNA-binding protein
MNCKTIFGLLCFLLYGLAAYSYKIITPEPFSIVQKNYIKFQLLQEKGDALADSIFFDVVYNTGSTLTRKLDASLSVTIALNDFNDGVFFVRARIYHGRLCDTLGSKYDRSGIPVILDRQPAFTTKSFQSVFIASEKERTAYFNETPGTEFSNNNNKTSFASCWDFDSLYFVFKIKDAHLNYTKPGSIDLFQARNYLRTLWFSDCIELDFDLSRDHSAWKDSNDYELLVDVQGNRAGNRWSAIDSFYTHWDERTRVDISWKGTVNNNDDLDTGYVVSIAVPWSEINYTPKSGQVMGFDVQYYDKDGALDEAFRTSISGTSPESNDNTSEWVSLVLEKKERSTAYLFLFLIPGFGFLAYWWFRKQRPAMQSASEPGPMEKNEPKEAYSDSIQKAIQYISDHYQQAALSRQEIAEQVFLSEQYLSTLFKKETGNNLVTYINQYRIQRAIELLETTRMSVSEIAYKVGFNSVQNFHKNFKSFTQKAPSDYR